MIRRALCAPASAAVVAAVAAASACDQPTPGETISADTWTDGPWPLTVPAGRLLCEPGRAAIVVTPDGRRFQLNGTASAERYRTRPLEEIWQVNPDIPGTRVNIGPMIARALRLCE